MTDPWEGIREDFFQLFNEMKWKMIRRYIMKGILCLLTFLMIVGGCSYLNHLVGLKDDNIIEEVAEEVVEHEIKKYTGLELDLDFTPY